MFWLGILNPNAAALVLKPFTKNIGSASALLGSVQMLSGSIATVIVSSLHDGSIFPISYLMAGWAGVFLLLLLGGKYLSKPEYVLY
jgi:DHA1 family bicyclomycin/chloramphenicol resistance-like MFS transporter